MKRYALTSLLGLMLLPAVSMASAPFKVSDIRLEGLQRIAPGTVFTYLPVAVGDRIDDARGAEIIRSLYKTGFFRDIELVREGEVLVVKLVERQSINTITVTGNEEINKEQLNTAMKDIGLVQGRIFNQSLLDRLEQELRGQYYSRGFYALKMESKVNPLDRNRVDVVIKIDEGKAARIHRINLIGNTIFTDDKLLGQFELSEPTMFSFISGNDKYAKQKLIGDLETLRSYYQDRGYLNFTVVSSQVSVTPDKRDVYVTINMNEGERFTVADVRLAGEFVVPVEELRKLVKIAPGDVFSRKMVTESAAAITERLGDDGYAFANVNPAPEVDAEGKVVKLTFFVDPGKKVYVRQIRISGNSKTEDEVIRREMRQQEGGWISTKQINRSRVRLQRLGYLKGINVETPPVPGTADQVDVNVNVSEGPSGSLQAGVGYGTNGFLVNLGVTEQNFLGTGKQLRFQFDNSRATTIYNVSYTNPYYTLDGVSRGFSVYSRSTDAARINIASYSTDVLGASVNFGIPISEFNTARFSLAAEQTGVNTTANTPASITRWINNYGNDFSVYRAEGSWSHDKRDRVMFPTKGMIQQFTLEASLPVGDLTYAKASHRQQWFLPLPRKLILSASTQLGYGRGYNGDELPFFENYFLGGVNSVRGFRTNSLGPRDNGRVIGGNKRVQAGLELLIPAPSEEYANSLRWSYFIDAGNVFGAGVTPTLSELRVAHGLAVNWMTPMGVLSFSLGWPLRMQPGDDKQRFQFNIGSPF